MSVWRGWEARLDRAHEHLMELELEERACIRRRKDATSHTIDAASGSHIFNMGPLNVPEYRLGILVGDVAHALRAALNHIAYEFAPAKWTAFPIFDESGDASRKGLEPFKGPVRDVLKAWQPYVAGKAAHHQSLWVIHSLDIVEKHQCVPIAPMRVNTGRPTLYGHNQKKETIFVVPSSGGPEPDFELDIAIGVSLDPFPEGKTIVPLSALSDAYHMVRDRVMPSLAKQLP